MQKKTYQKIEYTEAEHLKGDAHMTVIVKPVQHLNAETKKDESGVKKVLFM